MNLLELLHNEKVVNSLEKLSDELESIHDREGVTFLTPKTIILIEFILNRAGMLERSDIMFDLLKFITIDKKKKNNGNTRRK